MNADLIREWTAANRRAARAYAADKGEAIDMTKAALHAAANKRYRDRIRNNKENI